MGGCGTPGLTKIARVCDTALRVIWPEKTFWWKYRLLPPFKAYVCGPALICFCSEEYMHNFCLHQCRFSGPRHQDSKGVRYCVESHLARENLLVEIQIVATV